MMDITHINITKQITTTHIQTNKKGYRILRSRRGHIVLVLEKAGVVRLENGLGMRANTHSHKTDAVPEEQQTEKNEGNDGQWVVSGNVLRVTSFSSLRRAARRPT